MPKKAPETLRSFRWFGTEHLRSFAHRQRMMQIGFRRSDFVGRPVIGLINTWSEMSTCHYHLRERAEEIRRGIWRAGGFPIELPAMSLGEVMVKPSTMFYRNFLAMETEELIRSHPIDGVVLMGGCDKTTPALLMGAFSMGLPCIFFPAGPMLNGMWRNQRIGVGTDTKRFWDDLRGGRISKEDWGEVEEAMTRANGTCNTMGTASTMTSIVDAMGLSLTGASSIPAVDSAHPRMATDVGERIVEMVWEDLKPADIVTDRSMRNGLITWMALGGSTNAAVHLIGMAKRLGLVLTLDDMAEAARKVPVIADLMPSGRYLMEDFYYAGGLKALLWRIRDHLDLGALTVEGRTLGEAIEGSKVYNDEVIRPLDKPLSDRPTIAVLRGNLAPDGAVVKSSAASPRLLEHTGPAVVFDGYEDMSARIDDESLDVDENTVFVLRMGGSVAAGLPEWGDMQIPKKLLRKGVRDVLRVSDARMSGTRDGTCVLHVSPEAAVGGLLALVHDGDPIRVSASEGRLELLVDDAELERRRSAWTPPLPRYERGYGAMFTEHVMQASEGSDFDYLARPGTVKDPSIY
ncbi:MAG: dihydroxy-acid dehydratase [Rhodospirillales bacterium]|nr:dihydroxy-acid dehydratase [Rhodospirillales bacterium]